jgi:hypothetical protein
MLAGPVGISADHKDVATNVIDPPYRLALQVVLTLLIIELGWVMAVLVALLFNSMVIFYAIALVATAGSIICSYYYFSHDLTADGLSSYDPGDERSA